MGVRYRRGLDGSNRAFLAVIAFSLAGSVAQRAAGIEAEAIARASGLAIIALGCWSMAAPVVRAVGRSRALLAMGSIALLGAAVEIAGLYTGLPFGRYRYTGEWWPSVALPDDQSFPLLLPFAWLMLAGSSYLLFCGRLTGLPAIVAGGLLAAAVNWPMEPVMTRVLGYWEWTDPTWPIGAGAFGVPLLNSVGWFATSALAGAILFALGVRSRVDDRAPALVINGFLGFVVLLGLIEGPAVFSVR